MTPRAARNKNLQWRLIVNQETSGNPSSREGAVYLRGQVSEFQLYLDTLLVARSPDTGALTTDTFTFPSCCACHLRNTWGAGR